MYKIFISYTCILFDIYLNWKMKSFLGWTQMNVWNRYTLILLYILENGTLSKMYTYIGIAKRTHVLREYACTNLYVQLSYSIFFSPVSNYDQREKERENKGKRKAPHKHKNFGLVLSSACLVYYTFERTCKASETCCKCPRLCSDVCLGKICNSFPRLSKEGSIQH